MNTKHKDFGNNFLDLATRIFKHPESHRGKTSQEITVLSGTLVIHCCTMEEGTSVVWLKLGTERGRSILYAEESEFHLLSNCLQSQRWTEEILNNKWPTSMTK